jgi:alpha-D-xyloside xylohydrolase
VQAERGVGEAVVFARSATAGGQQFPVHWGGDCESSFASMAESLRGGLSLGLSGFGFWSHDIGGFEGTPSPEVFKRWVAFGLLSSHSRLHGSGSMRVPWDFDDEAVDVLRRFTRLKLRLMPYLWAAAVQAHEAGVPMMRAMLLEFADPTCATLDTQYMLGPDLLVAPVFSADGDVTYYLPDGAWTHLLTGEVVRGPRWVRERHGFDSLPLLVRPGAVVPVGAYEDRPDHDLADGVTLEVFGLPDGEERAVTVHAADGAVAARVRVRRDGDVVRATVDQGVRALGAWRLRWVTGAWGTAERGREVVASAGDTELLVSLD